MGLLSAVLAVDFRRRWSGFERACAKPVESQLASLRGLLARASQTEWGRKFGFSDIRTPDQFRRRVGLMSYEQSAPDWHRAFDGAADVTWPGHVRYFAMSSGTTATSEGTPGAGNKYLPVTHDAIKSNLRSGGILMAALARKGSARSVTDGRVLYLGGSTALTRRGRCLHGDASGIISRHIPKWIRGRSLPDDETRGMANWQRKIDRIIERYLTADVCALGACPSWASLLFKQMLETASKRGLGRTVGELWPKLRHFMSYGMSFGPYQSAFARYVGRDIHYTSTYSSSEAGMSAIQVERGGPLRLIVDNGVYYEFIPAGRAGDADAPRLHVGEVSEGEDYAVAVTTNGGIWSYLLGDVVRFESLRPPRIAFVGRTKLQLSAFGEHVTLGMIEAAVADACERTGAAVTDYTVAPRYPTPDQPVPGHWWIVEFNREPDDEAAFMTAVDDHIRRNNEDYDTHRTDDYGMAPPRLIRAAAGTFYEWMKAKGKLGGQHKVPRVVRSADVADELLAISRRLGR